MRTLRILLFAVLSNILLTGCLGSSGGGESASSSGSVSEPTTSPVTPDLARPVTPPSSDDGGSSDSRALWNEKQSSCLNGRNEPGLNAEPIGTDAQCVDFSNMDLTGKDFTSYDLRGSSFRNSVLSGVKLEGARISGLVLDGAEVDNSALLQWLTTGAKPAPQNAVSISPADHSVVAPVVATVAAPVTVSETRTVVPPAPAAPSAGSTTSPSIDTSSAAAPPVQSALPSVAAAPNEAAPSASAPVPVDVVVTPPSVAAVPIEPSVLAELLAHENVAAAPAEANQDDVDEELLPTAAPLIVVSEDVATAAPASEDIHLNILEMPNLNPATPPSEVVEHYEQVQASADLGRLGSQISLSSLKMRRQLQQIMVQINKRKLKETVAELKHAEKSQDTAGASSLKAKVEDQKRTLESVKAKVSELVSEIGKESLNYKQKTELKQRAAKVVQLVEKIKKSRADKKSRLPSSESLAASTKALELKIQSIDAQAAALADAKVNARAALESFDRQIESYSQQGREFDVKIKDVTSQIAKVKKQIETLEKLKIKTAKNNSGKSKGDKGTSDNSKDKEISEALVLQASLEQKLVELKTHHEKITVYLASLRVERAQPLKKIDDLTAQMRSVEQSRQTAVKQLREVELIENVLKLHKG